MPVCLLGLFLLGLACTGSIGDRGSGDLPGQPGGQREPDEPGTGGQEGSPTGGNSQPPLASGPCNVAPARAPLRRLTRAEYTNTIRDLLGITTTVADGFEADTAVAGFATNGIATLSPSGTEDYAEAASALASQVDLAKALPCAPDTGNATCARTFITAFGQRALRRPLVPAELDKLVKLQADKQSRSDFAAGIRLVIETLLQTPSFLYRPDIASGDDATAARLARGYELASRLSYFLWASMPDDKLFASAASGALLDGVEREAEVRRMMADPRTGAAVRSFHDQWTDGPRLATADKNSALFPQFQPTLKASMREETARFAEHVFQQENGSLKTLLTAPYGFVDAGLAKLYGVPAPRDGFAQATMPAGQRSGLLTQAGLMAGHAFAAEPSPIHRGLFVRRRLLCQDLALPPNVEIKPPVVDPNVSIKGRLEQHRADPLCASCHAFMDPIGFGFGHYDAIGRWQTMEGKFPVDAAGELVGTDDIDGEFHGALELGQRLAGSETVARCMTQQWFWFALGRLETDQESCLIDNLTAHLKARDLDLRELVMAIAVSDAFLLSRTN